MGVMDRQDGGVILSSPRPEMAVGVHREKRREERKTDETIQDRQDVGRKHW